jgi:glycosyltransferase involved in cell wall biosynthesis
LKLLFLTQRFDALDAILGFVPRWIVALSRHCERLRVVALDAGEVAGVPSNVEVCAVGRGNRVLRYFRYRSVLRQALLRERFDAVLAHMVPRYALLAAPLVRRSHARLFLWYTHGTVDERLERALDEVEAVFTASGESMRGAADKRIVTGHGIDLEHFSSAGRLPESPARLLVVGRLTPRKDPRLAVEALDLCLQRGADLLLDLVGDVLAGGDGAYRDALAEEVDRRGLSARVRWHGAVPYPSVNELYRACTLLVHPSRTGSLDKVVLEAMACERPIVSCNEATRTLLAELGSSADSMLFEPGDAPGLARRIEALLARPEGERAQLGARLRAIVANGHEVESLAAKLAAHMGACLGCA